MIVLLNNKKIFMKKTVLLIMVLLAYTAQGQDNYRLKLYADLYYDGPSSGGSVFPLITNGAGVINSSGITGITVFNQAGSVIYNDGNVIIDDAVFEISASSETLPRGSFILDDYVIDLVEKPYRVLFSMTIDYNVGGPGESDSGICGDFDYNLFLSTQEKPSSDSLTTIEGGCQTDVYLEAAVIPLLNTQKQICENDLLFDIETGNPMTSISGLGWEYWNIETTPFWESSDLFSTNYPLNRTITEILPSDYPQNTGVNVLLRYGYRPPGFVMSRVISDTAIIDITQSSPEITSFTTTNPLCSYSPLNMGSFTVTFDRALNSGETLTTVTLYHDGPDGDIDTADDVPVTTLIDLSYAGTTFTWPSQLPADQYRLEYQSGNSSISSVNCLEEYSPIIINTPTPVTFSATWTDVPLIWKVI